MHFHELIGKHDGQSALIVGGGPSGRAWELIARKVKPDIVIGVNGTIAVIGDRLDYWLCIEAHADRMPWFTAPTRGIRCVMKRLFDKVPRPENAVMVNRDVSCFSFKHPFRIAEIPYSDGLKYYWANEDWARESFDIRKPIMDKDGGISLFQGSCFTHRGQIGQKTRVRDVGTTMTNAIHFAGILGCSDVYTVGLDLYFPDGEPNHWYPERDYDEFADITDILGYATWDKSMYVRQYGLRTTWWWIEAANLLTEIKPWMAEQGLYWHDCSDGLLQRIGGVKMGRKLGDYHDLLSGYKSKECALVIGCGPSARHVNRIPFDRYTSFAVNSASLLARTDFYVAFDQYCPRFPWWLPECARYYIVGGPLTANCPRDFYEFYWDGWDAPAPDIPQLRAATATGEALQMAAMLPGVKRIDLTGCDMGNMPFHWYDVDSVPTERPEPNQDRAVINRMQELLDEIKRRGITVNHYGPTCLSVREI